MSYKRARTSYEGDKANTRHQPPFAIYGTPLPPLDSESRDDGTYVPLWKQEVRDERGRKRLHGAFTGGFSAGYFNTVGSKEGWTPSTFTSSRSQRKGDTKAAPQQRAEDFMDEEDLADLQESQKLQTQSGFSGLGSTEADKGRGGLFADLFRPSGDIMGIKLLQRMGWRMGQGIGPKVRRAARGDRDIHNSGEQHLFAPDDVPLIAFNRKTDKFGLGWAGEQRLGSATKPRTQASNPEGRHASESEDEDHFRVRKPTKSATKRGAFGVGILNDTGSDEEDPYEIGPKVSYNKVIGGDRKKRKGGIIANTSNSKTMSKPVFLSQKLLNKRDGSSFRRCHDGRLPLDGFILAAQALTLDDADRYAPPVVPEGWKPSRSNTVSAEPTKGAYISTAEAARASNLNPGQRASMLGEATLPGKSIFDFISSAARDRLAGATGTTLPQGKGEAAPAGFEPSAASQARTSWDLVPRLDKTIAQAALARGASGWMPYAEDTAKRQRYRTFLETILGTLKDLPPRAPEVTLDDWAAELREFAQAAQVFKPVSGAMASRFTSARAHDAGGTGDDSPAVEEKQPDPRIQAARLGMYGPLTRSSDKFYPPSHACRLLGVPPPAHVKQRERETTTAKRDASNNAAADDAMAQTATAASRAANASGDFTLSAPAAVDAERNAALEGQRAGDELFRAVFGSDDDDDE